MALRVIAVLIACIAASMMMMKIDSASAPISKPVLHAVGGSGVGWKPDSMNYTTDWAIHEHFKVGDMLLFKYDPTLYDVLQVSKTDYLVCSPYHPLRNISEGTEINIANGTGNDLVKLTQIGSYFYIGSGGYCQRGLNLAVVVGEAASSASSCYSILLLILTMCLIY